MPSQSRTGWRDALSRHLSLVFPILIVGAVLVMVAPLPPLLLDLLLAANITLAVVVLLTTIHVASPLEFSVFPSLLLGATLLRLVLNVASTRLILTQAGAHGTHAAGRVIEAFGDFVAAGSPTVGLIIFIILVTIQFVVITKGATRIGEVAARFALDGMPGRQMAVDADLANGSITKDEARLLRRQIAQQADFYGAMDGAGKFVRGDAVAGLVITFVNIFGGLYIGMLIEGMSFAEAVAVFTTLTIGDGLVAQVPAFLISIAAGLLVTRSSVDSDLSRDVVTQIFRHPVTLYTASLFLIVLAFTGLPAPPLLALGVGCAIIGRLLQTSRDAEPATTAATAEPAASPGPAASRTAAAAAPPSPPTRDHLRVESLELELGIGLIRLADAAAAGGDLLEHVSQLRNRIAFELGFIVPKVRVADNLRLDPRQFQIKLRGIPVANGEAYADALLAVDVDGVEESIPGIPAVEPAAGRPARWIEPGRREAARLAGYQVQPPQAFIIQHLSETVRAHAADLLTRQQVHGLLHELRARSPQLVDELVPAPLRPAQIQLVLCNLLRERIPIRDLEAILESLGNFGDRTQNPVVLTECVRMTLARTICQLCRDADHALHALTLDAELEDRLAPDFAFDETGLIVSTPRALSDALNRALETRLKRLTNAGRPPVIVCRPEVRAGLRQITARAHPRLHVLSHSEVTVDTQLVLHGELGLLDLEPSTSALRSAERPLAVAAA